MADKEFKIKIGTQGDPSGAKIVEEAIDDATDAVEELDAVTRSSNTGATDTVAVKFEKAESGARRMQDATADLGAETRQTDAATDALERSVELLNDELAKNKSLTTDQAANLRKVSDGGERLVRIQRQQAATADSGTKSTRNLGLAALAGAQAFEDMQYGIRGVLNNIPQIALMLGGGAGLTAIISIASVAGSILWEKMRQGPKEAAKETRDLLSELRAAEAVYADLERAASSERDQRSEALSKQLADQLAAIEFANRLASSGSARESLRIDSEKRVALAKQQLALAELESGVTAEGGRDAIKMALRRKEIAAEIVRIEKESLERTRALDLNTARQKLRAAEDRLNAIKESPAAVTAEAESNKLKGEIEALYDTVRGIQEARAAMIASLEQERAAAEAEIKEIQTKGRPGLSPAGEGVVIDSLEAIIERSTRRIAEVLGKPDSRERDAAAEAKAKEESLAQVEARLADLSKEQRAAAVAIRDAALALNDLRQRQTIQRDTEEQIGKIDARRQAFDQEGKQESDAIQALEGLTGQLDGQPALSGFVAQIKGFISDKALTADELVKTQTLLGQFFGKIAQLGAAQNQQITAAISRVDDLERTVRGLRTNSGNPTP